MIKRFILFAFIIFSFRESYAQFDTVFAKTNMRHCADSMATGFKTKNWELYVRYVYPTMIGSMGGKAEMIKFMDSTFIAVPGSAWKEYKAGKILQIIKTAGDLQAVIELISVLEWQGQRITTVTHMVGDSWDGGLFWRFFDSEGDMATAKLLKPDLSDLIIIPEKKEKAEEMPVKKNN